MRVRIKDIAEIAGVSPATVSLVLNNKPGVGNDMREKIRKIAEDKGYRQAKSADREGKLRSVCFLHISRHGRTVNRDHDVFIADYIEGLGQGARQQGFGLEILTFKSTPIDTVIDAARDHSADGFVVLGTELSAEDVQFFSRLPKPLVFLDTYHEFMQFDFVDMNNSDAVFTLLSHLYDKGHRDIGIVSGAVETRNFRLREDGFASSLLRLGLANDKRHSFAVDQTFHGAHEGMRALLDRGIDLPTALFCANDIIACGCLRAFKEKGVRIPDDVSLVGFDDLPLSAVVDPPLTTIQVSKAQIGRMAMQLLATRIRTNIQAPPVKVLIGGQLVVRQSVRQI
jgi:LacI family transcriptional regulator